MRRHSWLGSGEVEQPIPLHSRFLRHRCCRFRRGPSGVPSDAQSAAAALDGDQEFGQGQQHE